MKPGIPWSVKGIEQQARAAAKQAARQSGMTIGEWLNTVILDSAEGDDLERRYRRPPYWPKPLPGVEHGDAEGVTLRLEEIAEQLHTIARHESETALSRHAAPEDENQMRAILERLDAYEQQTSSVLGAMQERLEEVSERLGHERDPGSGESAAPQRGNDHTGYHALEGALRNIIEHIEVSETRTCQSIKSLQERLVEVMNETGRERASATTVGQLEQRVAELAESLAGAPNDLDEVRQTEQRLRSLFEEAKHAAESMHPGEDLSQLRREFEQLAASLPQGSGQAVSDLTGRVEQLEAELKSQFSERDQATQREVAALGSRVGVTERRLEHLATIEQSVAQLARSLEADRSQVRQSGASPELRALEDGLKAVRASAEMADRRTQETLQAVHETLEHIVGKLAELEAVDGPDDEVTGGETGEVLAEGFAEERAEELAREPGEDEIPAIESEPEIPPAPADGEAHEVTASVYDAEGFAYPQERTAGDAEHQSFDEPYIEVPDPTVSDAYAPSEPAGAPVREDYIAAARRAAQMASARNRNRFSQRMSGASPTPESSASVNGSTPKRGFVASLLAGLRGRKAKPAPDVKAAKRKSSRKRLILAGLVLLAAVSAYGAHRQGGWVPDLKDLSGFKGFSGFDGTLFAPKAAAPTTTPQSFDDTAPAGAQDRPAAVSDSLPAAIGPHSLRQAAIRGDAIAQFVVASRYLDGKAVARNEDQAARWTQRAARQGLAAAQYRLGSMYEQGRGMPLDRKEAKAWYEQAAGRGNVSAMHNLAVLHTEAGTESRNYELAAEWFGKAAERGLRDSQFNLAVLNEQGLGVPKDSERAVFWYSLAADQGDGEAVARAKALEALLAPETAKQVHARLLAWRPLAADRSANVVPVGDPSWLEVLS